MAEIHQLHERYGNSARMGARLERGGVQRGDAGRRAGVGKRGFGGTFYQGGGGGRGGAAVGDV